MNGYEVLARRTTLIGAPPGFATAAAKVAAGSTRTSSSPIAPGLTLVKGNSGPEVEWLQMTLNTAFGFSLKIDGDFGTKTDKAVKEFQKSRGIPTSGRVDDVTLAALTTVGPYAASPSAREFVGPPLPPGTPLDPYETDKKAAATASAKDAAVKAQVAATAANAAAAAAPSSAPAAAEAAKAQMAANTAQAAATKAEAAPTAQAAAAEASTAVAAAQSAAASTQNVAAQVASVAPAAAATAQNAATQAGTAGAPGNFLTRKVGGVPVWGVGLMGAGGLTLLGLLLKWVLAKKAA